MELTAWLVLFNTYPVTLYGIIFIFGLIIGSFLNVVIHRLPMMIEHSWKDECRSLLVNELSQEKPASSVPLFNLFLPHSHCPNCRQRIKIWHNIPVLSWLLLKARCAYCQQSISWRYPLIELSTALLSCFLLFFIWKQPTLTSQDLSLLLFYSLLIWGLITLSFIDFDTFLLPDQITYPLLWLGLLASVLGLTIPPTTAIIGAMVGYLSLWSVYWLFKLATKKEGMGYGDFKLLAVLGAWLGWTMIPIIVIISSVVGTVFGLIIMIKKRQGKDIPIPFGPYLAIAGLISLLWGETLFHYLIL